MKLKDYLKAKLPYFVCQSLVAVTTVLMLAVLLPGGAKVFSAFIGVIYVFGALAPLAVEYRKKSRFYNELMKVFDDLDRKNLAAEIISEPDFFEGALLYNVLRASNKACLEEINGFKTLQEEYREYIEMWVHEIKTPISSSKLMMQNRSGGADAGIAEELESIENYVEQVLFYARSSTLEKDYIIRKTSLEKPVFAALRRNSKLLIGAGVSVSARDLDLTVYSDTKWLEFILSQILINSAKYARETGALIEISAAETENGCLLKISDNGIGIPEGELPRIFDKGFTGTNGRKRGKSTGMGLYICKKLCGKLGVSISAASVPDGGTTIFIAFPKNSMTDIF